jgi:hypothetical protein
MAWVRGRDGAPATRTGRRIPARLALLLRRVPASWVLRAVAAAAFICPGHSVYAFQRLETSLEQSPNPPGPPPGHPEHLVDPVFLTADELLWQAELHGATR